MKTSLRALTLAVVAAALLLVAATLAIVTVYFGLIRRVGAR